MSKDWRSQAHVTWECKYHVVILPKYRQKVVFMENSGGKLARFFANFAARKEVELIEGNAAPDHIHMLLSVPPKYSIAHTVGFLKGKSANRDPPSVDENEGNDVLDEHFGHAAIV